MKRIIVSVTNDLTTDQRVHKICSTLFELDYNILLIGRKLKDSKDLTRKYKTFRFNLLFNKGFLFYAEFNLRLFLKLLFSKKDILYSNDLDTLLPNFLINKLLKKALIYDSHELFTEVPELIDRQRTKNFWLKIEGTILPKLTNCITVCDSIADYYKNKYKVDFNIVRNLPIKHQIKTSKFPFKSTDSKIVLYQGALNKGRGLELIIETMKHLKKVILVIIGDGDIKNHLVQEVVKLDLNEKIKFIPKLTPEALKKITPLADLGLSIEEDLGLNYKYALPNKLFDYIHAEIPVLVSDLPEMKKIVNEFNVGEVITNREPQYLAKQIESILEKKESGYFNENLELAKMKLNWKNESRKISEILTSLN